MAIAEQLKAKQPNCHIVYVGERGGKFDDIADGSKLFDEVYRISSGKFRRYSGQSKIRNLLDLKVMALNARDVARIARGIFQARRIVKKVKPDVVLQKGGYVGVPVSMAAGRAGIKLVTHDSDSLPGLANRMVSKWATVHATAMPAEFYNYPKEKTKFVGPLLANSFQHVDAKLQAEYRKTLGLPGDAKVLFVTGGSLGAQRLNTAVAKITPALLAKYKDIRVVVQVGRGNRAQFQQSPRLIVKDFIYDMYRYMGAADVVITRAGATNLAELGMQGRACVVVPNPLLTGGHQVINAQKLAEQGAVVVVTEQELAKDAKPLLLAAEELLDSKEKRTALGDKFQSITPTGGAAKLANILLELAGTKQHV